MRTFEIRLVGHTGRVAEVYIMDAETVQEAIERADLLVKTHPEIAGAQVAEEMGSEGAPTIH
jgi:hypothetical protein